MTVPVVNKTPEVIIHRRQSTLSEHLLAYRPCGFNQYYTKTQDYSHSLAISRQKTLNEQHIDGITKVGFVNSGGQQDEFRGK